MVDMLNLAMLVGVSIASLAFGVFAAYGILRAAFSLMHPPPRVPVSRPGTQMAQLS